MRELFGASMVNRVTSTPERFLCRSLLMRIFGTLKCITNIVIVLLSSMLTYFSLLVFLFIILFFLLLKKKKKITNCFDIQGTFIIM